MPLLLKFLSLYATVVHPREPSSISSLPPLRLKRKPCPWSRQANCSGGIRRPRLEQRRRRSTAARELGCGAWRRNSTTTWRFPTEVELGGRTEVEPKRELDSVVEELDWAALELIRWWRTTNPTSFPIVDHESCASTKFTSLVFSLLPVDSWARGGHRS